MGGFALHRSAEAALPTFYPDPKASDEDFWRQVRLAYAASPNMINLNNGGVSPMPRAAMDALDYYTRMSSEAPSYYMWRTLDQSREPL
ncbi:MAG: aminotransferase, partial [Saprospiraceae bacterium]